MELYGIGKGHRPSCLGFVMLLCAVIFNSVSSAPVNNHRSISDECDWFGSSLEEENSGIQPVYLRCREGAIEWQYPRGALRIILRLGQSNKEFRGCLQVTPFSSGATLYLEEPQKLKYVYGANEENQTNTDQVCFKSSGRQVALFLEAKGTPDFLKKDTFKFLYDLELLNHKSFSECRPCSERELLYRFCTSDFVARGFISSLYQNEIIHQTELTIHSHEIIRESEPKVFNSTESHNKDSHFVGVVNRPLHCGTRVGSGEFLFIGRWRLGVPVLTCAPRWSEWETVRQNAIHSGNLDCIID